MIGLYILAALAVFVAAGIQLVAGLDDDDPVGAETPTSELDSQGSLDTSTSVEPSDPATDADDADDLIASTEPEPEPTPTGPPPPVRAIVRADDGTVISIGLRGDDLDAPVALYGNNGQPGAAWIGPVGNGLAIVTADGDIDLLARATPGEAERVWSAAEMGPARQVVQAGARLVVLEASGSIVVFDRNAAPRSPDEVTRIHDTSIGGTPPPARSMPIETWFRS